MIEQDTVKLLRECDAGIRMGTESIDEVVEYVRAPGMRDLLNACRYEHTKLGTEIRTQLDRFQDKGKSPNPIVQKMGWVKTGMKLAMDESDETIADLMTDGCNMGFPRTSPSASSISSSSSPSTCAATCKAGRALTGARFSVLASGRGGVIR